MIDKQLYNFLCAFKKFHAENRDHDSLDNIKESIFDFLYSLGYTNLCKSIFEEFLKIAIGDKDPYFHLSDNFLAFVLNFTEVNIYQSDINKYVLLEHNTKKIYNLLYANQELSLKDMFYENEETFFYSPKQMLQVFIDHGLISLRGENVL